MTQPLVVAGNGMTAARCVEAPSKRQLGRHAVAVVGAEPRLSYNRVLLSSLLADEVTASDIEMRPAQWWSGHGVTMLYGHAVTAIDTSIRRVRLANGASLPFTRL